MQPYLLTLAFLTLMSILTSTEVVRFAESSMETRLYHDSLATGIEVEELRANSHLEDFRKHQPEDSQDEPEIKPKEPKPQKNQKSSTPRRSRALGFNLDRPPNNARLNLYQLAPLTPLYDVTARLLRSLYKDAPFFDKVPQAEERLLAALIAKKEESEKFLFPDELANLKFDDEEIQTLFHLMLKGHDQRPSLLHFITFDKITSTKGGSSKINFMFADERILRAVVDNDAACNELLALREKVLEEMISQEEKRLAKSEEKGKNRLEYKKQLTEAFDAIVANAGLSSNLKPMFDFTLRTPGNVIFVTDEESGIVLREKIQPRLKA